MSRLSILKFKSVRTKLMFLFVAIGVIPAAIVATVSYNRSRDALRVEAGGRVQSVAEETIDKLDRLFFERYGDVQAFAANPDAKGDAELLKRAANFYTRTYGIYDLMVIADANGQIIAANTVNSQGAPFLTDALIGTSVKGEAWFESVTSGTVPLGQSYFGDVTADKRLADATKTRGLSLVFAAPIVDADGKVTRVWANYANWERTGCEIMTGLRQRLKDRGATTSVVNLINKQGFLLEDPDPAAVLTFNLVDAKLQCAIDAAAGKSGVTIENNKRTGTEQINGFAGSKGALGFKGYGWGVLVRQDTAEAFAAASQLAYFVAALTGGMALAIAAIGFFVARSFARPLVATANTLELIAAGDLTKRVEVQSNDEIGRVGDCVNKLSSSLQDVVRKIVGSSRELASSSEELTSTATQMAQSAEGTTQQSATVAAAAEEMSTNMRTMAASTEEMSSNIKTVAAAVEELTASVSEIARSAESSSGVASQAAELATISNDKVRQLGVAADEIGKVIDVIQDIADQTNLLALNATIEAARAGEAGKGFAVVATEVKELAKQSAAATDSIRQRIQGMQGSTTDTVKAIAEIGAAIKNVNDVAKSIAQMVDQQSTATQEISRNIVQTSQAASSVSRGVTESASACQEITKTIIGVDQAAKSTAAGASQTKSSGTQLSQLAETLQGLVVEFRV
ncbi:MAG: methyl-accepting chemotaxis protein [Planctomycetia bacterium]|nr:methyl-accepting chemotaxis protein [Planctomycetia bacterium]